MSTWEVALILHIGRRLIGRVRVAKFLRQLCSVLAGALSIEFPFLIIWPSYPARRTACPPIGHYLPTSGRLGVTPS